ncbi:Unknown protein [Striga hermonthica]|uniref:Retrotransposon Copia-like N-terminal domain-containing protein n=1 Tax=Striga hermonthica TaxID=68872 RepID=A0A9N7RMI8_STRHE|nr:Unknown protein [Striga hermonthica]
MATDENRALSTGNSSTDLSEKFDRFLQTLQQPTQTAIPQSITLNVKLNQHNFPIWSRLMKVAIGGRGKLRHLTGNPPPPSTDSPEYSKWEEHDLTICSWLLENMEPDVMLNYAEFPSAREIWNNMTLTFAQSRDGVQIFDLIVKANTIRRGTDSIEDFFSKLQRLWRDIEQRQINPMRCPEDIAIFNQLRSEQKLYQFLAGVGEEFATDRRELLNQEPLPAVETAYATIRRERDRRTVMGHNEPSPAEASGIGSGLKTQIQIGEGTAAKNSSVATKLRSEGAGSSRRSGGDKSKLWCTHCGRNRHTKETCFLLIGFPEGWDNRQRESQIREAAGSVHRKPTATMAVEAGSAKPEEKGMVARAQMAAAAKEVGQQTP